MILQLRSEVYRVASGHPIATCTGVYLLIYEVIVDEVRRIVE